MNIGSRLKQILSERDMNVNQLAREADIPAQTLYAMISRDSNKADMDIIARLLNALDMDFMDFMGQEWKKNAGQRKAVDNKAAEPERKTEPVKADKAVEPELVKRTRRGDIEDYLL